MERTADPDQIGLDPRQLDRLDEHFSRYVDDGRLAGWQMTIARAGQVGHAPHVACWTWTPVRRCGRTRCGASTR